MNATNVYIHVCDCAQCALARRAHIANSDWKMRFSFFSYFCFSFCSIIFVLLEHSPASVPCVCVFGDWCCVINYVLYKYKNVLHSRLNIVYRKNVIISYRVSLPLHFSLCFHLHTMSTIFSLADAALVICVYVCVVVFHLK